MALMALLSSCETVVEQSISVEVLPADEQTVFTANLGVDTKTYLEYSDGVYKTRWDANDQIFVLSTDSSDSTYWYDTADLIEGAGASTAKFAVGSNVRGDHFYAFYGRAYYSGMGKFWPVLAEYQYGLNNNLDGYYFPMYAESDTRSFAFKNLCSILKVDIVGTDYIDNVIFTPNDPTIPVAGEAVLTFVDNEPVLTFYDDSLTSHKVCFYVRQTLSETEPISCYISIPPQTYTGGFTLTINSNIGSMDVNVPEDVTFERSQIRSVSTITYENKSTVTWGLIGSMTGWSEDMVMTPVEEYHVLENVYLEDTYEFKFRANASWDVNIGAAYGNETLSLDTWNTLDFNTGNIRVPETGNYNIYLDPSVPCVYIEKTESEEPEYVVCTTYDEVAALPDSTNVMVQGFVLVPYGRGFVMNIGDKWGNSILVYQGTDQSAYTPVMGNLVTILAKKVTYNNLPELTSIQEVKVENDQVVDYGYSGYYNLYDPAVFAEFQSDRYVYVKYSGTLEKSGSYHNVVIDGLTERMGSIEFPIQDLTEYIGKKVSVEGWFIGLVSGNKYLKTVLRSISLIDDDASTEDVTPGDDIIVM